MDGKRKRNINEEDRNKKKAERRRSWEEEKVERNGDAQGEEGKRRGKNERMGIGEGYR
jgi:hypothetical protein